MTKPTNGKHTKKKKLKPSTDPAFIFRVEDSELACLLSAFVSVARSRRMPCLAVHDGQVSLKKEASGLP